MYSPPGADQVYPRACGGTPPRGGTVEDYQGLSPRVRGNQSGLSPTHLYRGSIPARAGEPFRDCPFRPLHQVYPRACGGTLDLRAHGIQDQGLSPRVRGNRGKRPCLRQYFGSIPARAGEPVNWTVGGGWDGVYPRACGGTGCWVGHTSSPCGLSPRVRGNHGRRPDHTRALGSIPARAGEPSPVGAKSRGMRVYPRACGGTGRTVVPATSVPGLSPRVRGNLSRRDARRTVMGSIPARAGEPMRSMSSPRPFRVYPRACGGTLMRSRFALTWSRSIPARAGEPTFQKNLRRLRMVYPRACGGTHVIQLLSKPLIGLSPRVRGNLGCSESFAIRDGSIPARAGGTSSIVQRRWDGASLSPRVRGNQHHLADGAVSNGSIPARAGEPHEARLDADQDRVYPRACGGTQEEAFAQGKSKGLSPRVRGNRNIGPCDAGRLGSIPARAGEPKTRFPLMRSMRVYPRACGGTACSYSTVTGSTGLSPRVRGNRRRARGRGDG